MKHLTSLTVATLLLTGTFIGPTYAGGGNGAPSGAHYNLNIIGVEKGKSSPMTGSDRHTIFVALGKEDSVTSKIYLTPGEFHVCDGNAFDPAFDCNGNQIQAQGAVFQLPCNTNIPADITCEGGTVSASYEVWGRALGQPGGGAVITTCATDPLLNGAIICSTENTLRVFVRRSGKSTFTNVTNQLTSLVADIDGNGTFERVALFSGGLVDFFWQYDNNGLRLAQLRFYLLE